LRQSRRRLSSIQMAHSWRFIWPSWAGHDLWRWGMVVLGWLLIAHGLFSKHMRMRDGLGSRIAAKRWQIVYMRTLFLVIGVALFNLRCFRRFSISRSLTRQRHQVLSPRQHQHVPLELRFHLHSVDLDLPRDPVERRQRPRGAAVGEFDARG
jgi:hypothetical protein